MTENTLTARLRQARIIPVIVLQEAKAAYRLGEILSKNGLPVAEITFRTAAAAEAITILKKEFPHLLVAAGTVLTEDQLAHAQQAGADCIITPGFNPQIVARCQQQQLMIIPGVNNPMSIEAALAHGIQLVKFFPAEASGGVAMIKALLGPYGMLQIIPTGGITPENIHDYLALKAVVACGGSWMVSPQAIAQGDWDHVEKQIRQTVALLSQPSA